jgi:hypothetical protein
VGFGGISWQRHYGAQIVSTLCNATTDTSHVQPEHCRRPPLVVFLCLEIGTCSRELSLLSLAARFGSWLWAVADRAPGSP